MWETQLDLREPSHSCVALAAGQRRMQDTYAHDLWFPASLCPPHHPLLLPYAAVHSQGGPRWAVSVLGQIILSPLLAQYTEHLPL